MKRFSAPVYFYMFCLISVPSFEELSKKLPQNDVIRRAAVEAKAGTLRPQTVKDLATSAIHRPEIELITVITNLIQHPDPKIREEAAHSLDRIGMGQTVLRELTQNLFLKKTPQNDEYKKQTRDFFARVLSRSSIFENTIVVEIEKYLISRVGFSVERAAEEAMRVTHTIKHDAIKDETFQQRHGCCPPALHVW